MKSPEPVDEIQRNIKILSSEIWNDKIRQPDIDKWLNNFGDEKEKLNALYLLSKFVYFGNKEMYETLKVLYRDKIKYPILRKIREDNNNDTDADLLNTLYQSKLKNIRILGVGNPSESGVHLLYMFRQINKLPKDIFINTHEIFSIREEKQILRNDDIEEYIFIDDLCGSGTQAKRYSDEIIKNIKFLKSDAIVKYIVIVATEDGLKKIEDSNLGFDVVTSIFMLDNTYKCFNDDSRYFSEFYPNIDKEFCMNLCQTYKKELQYKFVNEYVNPLGYQNSQLLLSFFHNTPNNTLPIFWFEEEKNRWNPIFKRHPKIYSNNGKY